MQNWNLPNITAYWDERVDAIERFSRLIEATAEADQPKELAALSDAVTRQAAALSDADLVKSAIPIVEDLYKAVSGRTYIDEPVLQYLEASCAPYFNAIRERGYFICYFINNTHDSLVRPVAAYPAWFAAAKLLYLCPQHIPCQDKPEEQWPELVKKYAADGRQVAQELVSRCRQEGRHFVYLDIDPGENDFAFAKAGAEDSGAIFMYREEAPTPGSRIVARLPTERRPLAAG